MECDVQMIAAITRAVVYIIATAGGVLSVYLGYRLYMHGVESAVSGSASHSGWSGTLRSTGPGVFLVLFGAAILATVIFSKAEFATEESVENGALSGLLTAPAHAAVRAAVAAPGNTSSRQTRQTGGKTAKDCIVERRVTKQTTSFVDGGPLANARLRRATKTSLALIRDAQAKETDLDRLRSLVHARETLEALSAELADD